MRSRTWRLMAALFLMCSRQTPWAYRSQFPVCPKHYYSSQRVLKSITSKEMVSPAEFSKASFFTAINRSSSNSSESKGDEKVVLDKEWQAPCSLQRARCFQGSRCPVCSWLSGWFSAGQIDFLQPLCRQGSPCHSSWICLPERLTESPGTSGNPGGWRRY